jgi:putative aldouronate transport system substrate-binding protein
VRQDWLDALGIKMPTNQTEFTEMLRKMRDGDPNGNGQKDEIAVGARKGYKWMPFEVLLAVMFRWSGLWKTGK